MAQVVAVAGSRTSNVSVKVYDDSGGAASFSRDTGGTANGVALDADGNIFSSGIVSSDTKTYSWEDDGDNRWNASVAGGNNGYKVAADGAGGCYVAVEASICLAKYTSAGSLSWSKTDLSKGYSVFVSPAGRVYCIGNQVSTGPHIFCYDSSGTKLWDYTISGVGADNALDICTADDVTIYVAGRASGISLWKLTRNDGNNTVSVAWTKDHGATLVACALTPSGGVVAGGVRSSSLTTRQYSSGGTLEWSADHGAQVYAVAADKAGNVYTAGTRTSNLTTRKYNSSGTLQWSTDYGATARGIAVWDPSAIETEPPGLALGLSLASPFVGPSVSPSALPLQVALALPLVSSPPVPPDIVGMTPSPRQVFRLYLATEDLVELPLAEITCKRRLGASTWLTIRVPIADKSTRDLCTGHIGRDLVIYSGVAVGEVETLGEYLHAVLTEVESDWSPLSGGITLTGRVQNPSYTAATRVLAGVLSRGMDKGLHTATGAVDPLLRPNDTIDDGADTWTVGAVDVRIGPGISQMRVTEDG